MIAVPTLEEIARDRTRLDGLSFAALWAILRDLGLLEREVTAAMLAAQSTSGVATVTVTEDRMLTISEAAARLHVAEATMQKWLRKPPYNAAVVVRSRSMVRVSAQRLDDILLNGGRAGRRKAG
jgi:hypothetical protein